MDGAVCVVGPIQGQVWPLAAAMARPVLYSAARMDGHRAQNEPTASDPLLMQVIARPGIALLHGLLGHRPGAAASESLVHY